MTPGPMKPGRRPGTFTDEFEGASEAEIRASRPETKELGSRNSTLLIFLALIGLGLALVVGAALVYQDQALALYESITGSTLLGDAGTPSDEPATGTEGETGTTGEDTSETTTTAAEVEPPPEPKPPEPKAATLATLTTTGRVSQATVEKRFKALTPKLQKCLDAARERAPELTGSLEIAFSIKWNGKTSGYKATPSGATDKKFEACVKKQVTRGKWPKPRDGGKAGIKQVLEF